MPTWRSTLRILPRRGSTAWVRLLRACLVDPPAESPSTRKISVSALLVEEQSASLPGSVDLVSTDLRRTSSRAFLAASAALKACGGQAGRRRGGAGQHACECVWLCRGGRQTLGVGSTG